VHIVHLSSADALEILRKARAEGLPISAETCPHYLTFSAEEIPDGATPFKCTPPIREAENRQRLWRGLADGDISLVVSDHSPCVPALKRRETGDFHAAWGGIASLQLGLSAVWTGAKARGISLAKLGQWMSSAPATLVGLAGRKGAIAPGLDADFVLLHAERCFGVDPSLLRHRHPVTPYARRELWGQVAKTFLRGVCIYDRAGASEERRGEQLRRQAQGAPPW
jgi:allantoinase